MNCRKEFSNMDHVQNTGLDRKDKLPSEILNSIDSDIYYDPYFKRWGDNRGYINKISSKKKNENENERCILFIHGGGFNSFSPKSYQSLTYILAHNTLLDIFAPDYNTEENYHFPEHINDIDEFVQKSLSPRYNSIVLIGDSAGGTIALGLLIKNIVEKKFIFTLCTLYSPWIDLGCTSNSYDTNKWCNENKTGDMIFKNNARTNSKLSALTEYISNKDLKNYLANPYICPEYILEQFPPILIFVGSEETLRDENIIFSNKIQKVNPNAFLYIFSSVWHDWLMYTQDCESGHFDKAWQVYKITTDFISGGYEKDDYYFSSEINFTNIRYVN